MTNLLQCCVLELKFLCAIDMRQERRKTQEEKKKDAKYLWRVQIHKLRAPGASLMLMFKLFRIVRLPMPALPFVIIATNSP